MCRNAHARQRQVLRSDHDHHPPRMTGSALLGLALLAAPFTGCGWAWIQWHREQLALPLVLTAVEPSTARQDCAPGEFEPCPWVKAA